LENLLAGRTIAWIRLCKENCGKIHEVEVFPFVVLPYGYGNGWTPGAGR